MNEPSTSSTQGQAAPSSYAWDVFLSYKRDPPVGPWVLSHFYRLFVGWLTDYMRAQCPQSAPPRVFLDVVEIPGGAAWNPVLQQALATSRVLVPICSPSYFESDWCMSEWEHFASREATLGRQDLIVPLCHNNRSALPPVAKARQIVDFSDLIPSAATIFTSPSAFELYFYNKVGAFAGEVAKAACSPLAYRPWSVTTTSVVKTKPTAFYGLDSAA